MPIPVLPEANRSVSDNRRFVPCSVTGIPVVDEAGPPAEYTCHGEHRPDWHEPAGIVATQLVTLSLQYVSDRGVVMFHCHIVWIIAVSYTHLRAHETRHDLVCRLLLEIKNKTKKHNKQKYKPN